MAPGTEGIQQVAKNSAHCGLAFLSNLSLDFHHFVLILEPDECKDLVQIIC